MGVLADHADPIQILRDLIGVDGAHSAHVLGHDEVRLERTYGVAIDRVQGLAARGGPGHGDLDVRAVATVEAKR